MYLQKSSYITNSGYFSLPLFSPAQIPLYWVNCLHRSLSSPIVCPANRPLQKLNTARLILLMCCFCLEFTKTKWLMGINFIRVSTCLWYRRFSNDLIFPQIQSSPPTQQVVIWNVLRPCLHFFSPHVSHPLITASGSVAWRYLDWADMLSKPYFFTTEEKTT